MNEDKSDTYMNEDKTANYMNEDKRATSVNMEICQIIVGPNKMPQKIDMLKRVQFCWPRK